MNCQNCGNIEKKHVNDVKAKPNRIIILAGIIIGIIPALFWQEQMKSSKLFNSYMLGRK